MEVDWVSKLGTMADEALSAASGVSVGRIRRRREALGIERWTIAQAIAPFEHLLTEMTNAQIGRLAGVSPSGVGLHRRSLGVPPFKRKAAGPRIPQDHPVKPYAALIGLVDDKTIGKLAGVPARQVTQLRELVGMPAPDPAPLKRRRVRLKDFEGPLLGYESLFDSMSDAKISRQTGVPLVVVEQRRTFLKALPYKRRSRLDPYEHLIGVVSNSLLAKLVGLSPARVRDIRIARSKTEQ